MGYFHLETISGKFERNSGSAFAANISTCLILYFYLFYENKELIFPSTSSVNRNWFPVNCGCSLAHPGCATQLAKLPVTGWGRGTEKHLSRSRDGAVQGALPPPSALPPYGPFCLFCFPSSFSPSLWTFWSPWSGHCWGSEGDGTRVWVALPCAQETPNQLFLCV